MLVTQPPPVQVFLKNKKGKSTTYDITPEETVDHFKARVEKREEVPVSLQRLLHQSTEITTGRLTDYDVTNHSTIHLMSMLVTQRPPVQVFLRNEKGKSTTYDITPEETVDHFKARVEKREGVPMSRQRLLHQSREMTTGRLTDYNITNHSTIHLMSVLVTQPPPVQVFGQIHVLYVSCFLCHCFKIKSQV
uniref:Ubiquitin-like domain-containing protein n=1 Tax=Sparus aurata TaxID=8175 RepID=A0A671XAL4_SPAAU